MTGKRRGDGDGKDKPHKPEKPSEDTHKKPQGRHAEDGGNQGGGSQ